MEQNFQTSFIPKKPIIEERIHSTRPISFLTVISIFIFLAMIVIYGALYFYKGTLANDSKKLEESLIISKKSFDPEQIDRLHTLDKRLSSAGEIFSKHMVVSPIFQKLQKITEKSVRYTRFNYSATGEVGDKVYVKMSGQALNYEAIALQADLFSKNKDLIDPVFSNLSLDEKTSNVTFDLDFSVNSEFVNYKKTIAAKE